DHHVGSAGQLEDETGALGLLEVDRDAALVPVHRRVDGAHAVSTAAELAKVVASPGALDLHHVGAEVAEQSGAVGAGDDPGEVEDVDAVKNCSGPPDRGSLRSSRSPRGCLSAR